MHDQLNDTAYTAPPRHGTEKQERAYNDKLAALKKTTLHSLTVSVGCALEVDGKKRHEGEGVEPGSLPAPVLRALLSKGVLFQTAETEIQRRKDLPRATHIVRESHPGILTTDGRFLGPGDPAFCEDFAVAGRDGFQYAGRNGVVRTVPARQATEGDERFTELVDSGVLVTNPKYQRKRGK